MDEVGAPEGSFFDIFKMVNGNGKYVFIRKQNYVHTQSLVAELMFPCDI